MLSINYWIKPDYSWRRSLAYQVYRATRSQYMYQYYSLTLFALGVRYYAFSHLKRSFYKEIKHLPFKIVLMLYFFDNSSFLFMKQSKHKFIALCE